MHYKSDAFTVNGQPTIVALGGQTFGNAPEYSDGDIATLNWIYPVRACQLEYDLFWPIPSISHPLVFEASMVVNSNAIIAAGNKITYDGGGEVLLNPGFQTKQGVVFQAVIEGCGGVCQMAISPEMEQWIRDAENQHPNQEASEIVTNNLVTTQTAVKVDISPNPFTASATISYTLPAEQNVDIKIFNTVGKLVAQPIQQELQDAGLHEYAFAAGNLPTGVYFLIMQINGQKLTKHLVLTR